MVSFELGKEIGKYAFRLVKSVGQRKDSESHLRPSLFHRLLDQFLSSPFCSLVNGPFLFPAIYL